MTICRISKLLRRCALALPGLLAVPALSSAQQGLFKPREPDSAYVRTYPRHVVVRLYLGEKISIFNLIDRDHDRALHYRPNNILGIGAGITVRGIGLNFSTRLPFHDTKEDLYGRTRRLDLQIHRYSPMLALDVYAQYYRGFHLNSTDDVDRVVSNTTYPYFKELTASTAGASALYVLNGRRFSLRSGISQQEWQRRSAGSLMLGAAAFARSIRNKDTGILPPYHKYPDFFDGRQPQRIDNYSFTVKAGYGYNFVFGDHYFASLTADAGAGPGYSVVKDLNGQRETGVGLVLTGNLKASVGYMSDKWITGLYLILNSERFDLPYDRSVVSSTQGIIRLAVARRLTTNKRILQSRK